MILFSYQRRHLELSVFAFLAVSGEVHGCENQGQTSHTPSSSLTTQLHLHTQIFTVKIKTKRLFNY
jgi:hypothetical protein